MTRMRRREFIPLFGMAAAWPVRAQQQPAMSVVGVLSAIGQDRLIAAARQGLTQSGFIEGKNVAFEERDGQSDRLRALADELVARRVAVIVANSTAAALAAKAATTTIPIVFTLGSDPVQAGLVASFNRPGGNITGVTFISNIIVAKRLELLHEILPKATTIAMLVNPNNANADLEVKETEAAAKALGLKLSVIRAGTEREIDAAFESVVQQHVIALFVVSDSYFGVRRGQILALATRHGIATSFAFSEYVAAGGLMSYGTDNSNSGRQAGIYVARILKGEKPADLPVMQPTRFELVLNLNTAKALRIEIPAKVLALADNVIE
jgi:putative ABC transport system substrate-binding protein